MFIGITGKNNSVTVASASRETDRLEEHNPDHKGSINYPINARNIKCAVFSDEQCIIQLIHRKQ